MEIYDQTQEQQQKEPYKMVGTKLTSDEVDKLDKIAELQGTTKYEIMQNLAAAYIRLCDPGCVITEDMNKLRIAFEIDTNFSKRMNLTDPSTKCEVQEATYFLGDPAQKGMRLVHVYKPFMGDAQMTENTGEILERTMCEMNPVLYQKMRVAMVSLGCTSILDFLLKVVMETEGIDDVNEFERLFSDVRKNDFGKELAEEPYKRTMTNSMETAEQRWWREHQLEISFD